MADLGEGLGRRGADLVGGAVGAFEIGEAGLDRGVAAFERVEIRVRHHGRVGLVIREVRGVDLACQHREFGLGLGGGQVFDGSTGRHRGSPGVAGNE